MIWEFCIPRRVVELQIPAKGVLSKTNCDLSWTNRRISAPPIITRVCRESRKVAFENGGPLENYSEVAQYNFNWKATDAWFSPKCDIVAWYWRPEQQVDYELEVVGDPLSYFVQYALQAQGALMLAEHIYPFIYLNPTTDSPPTLEEVELTQLTQLKTILVCVKMLGIHATAAEAKESELWGTTGEDIIQIVDATDLDRIRSFSGDLLSARESEMVFNLLAEGNYREELARWKRELTTWWIWQHWLVAFRRRFKDVPEPTTIFVDLLAGGSDLTFDMLHPTTFWAPEMFPYFFDMTTFVENMDHPWVARILETMPDFRPVVMLRLCTQDCQEDSTDGARQDELEFDDSNGYSGGASVPGFDF